MSQIPPTKLTDGAAVKRRLDGHAFHEFQGTGTMFSVRNVENSERLLGHSSKVPVQLKTYLLGVENHWNTMENYSETSTRPLRDMRDQPAWVSQCLPALSVQEHWSRE